MSSSPVEYSLAPPARDPYQNRRPPYSEDAEQAVIAAMLMDADAIMRAAEHVDDTMFYREGHRRIFRAMVALTEKGSIVDPLTLSSVIVVLAAVASLAVYLPARRASRLNPLVALRTE